MNLLYYCKETQTQAAMFKMLNKKLTKAVQGNFAQHSYWESMTTDALYLQQVAVTPPFSQYQTLDSDMPCLKWLLPHCPHKVSNKIREMHHRWEALRIFKTHSTMCTFVFKRIAFKVTEVKMSPAGNVDQVTQKWLQITLCSCNSYMLNQYSCRC